MLKIKKKGTFLYNTEPDYPHFEENTVVKHDSKCVIYLIKNSTRVIC